MYEEQYGEFICGHWDLIFWPTADQPRDHKHKLRVRQGMYLKSVLLFNRYINDIPSTYENTLSDSSGLPNGAKLNSLFFPDSLITIQNRITKLP